MSDNNNNAMKYVVDTNVLLEYPEIFNEQSEHTIIIHTIVASELDNQMHNKYGNDELAYKARMARNAIKSATNKAYSCYKPDIYPKGLSEDVNDDVLLTYCLDNDNMLCTNDLAMQIKADTIGVKWFEYVGNCNVDYTGFKEVVLSQEEQAVHYQCPINKWDLNINEYLIIKDEDGNIIDKQRWTEKGFKNLNYKTVDNRYVGKTKPRNIKQELYMDLLQDKESKVKIVQGGYGTGKDYLALANFLHMVDKGQYSKIIWIRNNIEAHGTKPIGYLPGSLTEKLSVYADIVGDFVGDKEEFEFLLKSGKIELLHAGFLRGRDLRNSIIYCTEAQNMSASLVKLIVSRISENSIAFFNGDVKQIDDNCFKKNNGLNLLISKLKGNPLFGYVFLDKCERSEVAQLASLLD